MKMETEKMNNGGHDGIKGYFGLEKGYLGPMSSGKKYAAKNALIKKEKKGESADFMDLLEIHGVDTETLNSFLKECKTNAKGSYVLTAEQQKAWANIIETSDKKVNIDKRNKAIMNLWQRYHDLILGCRNDLERMATGHKTVLESSILDDYENESFETFLHALNILDIPRMAHMKGSWTFWFTLKAYLIARNKSIINSHLKKIKNECNEWTKSEDGEDVSIFNTDIGTSTTPEEDFLKNEERKVLSEAIPLAYKKFNDTQRIIWGLKQNGNKKSEISRQLGVKVKEVNDNLKAMKLMISKEIRTLSYKYNVTVEW